MNPAIQPHPDSPFTPKAALGIALILVGLSWTLCNLGLASWTLLRFWPVLLLLMGLSVLWRRGFLESVGGHLLLLGGLVGFAGEFEREDLLERLWPVAILWVGIVLTLRALQPRARCRPIPPPPPLRPSGFPEPLPVLISDPPPAPLPVDRDECSHDAQA